MRIFLLVVYWIVANKKCVRVSSENRNKPPLTLLNVQVIACLNRKPNYSSCWAYGKYTQNPLHINLNRIGT